MTTPVKVQQSPTSDYKTTLHTILADSLEFQSIEAAFFGILVHEENGQKERIQQFLETFKQYWTNLAAAQQQSDAITMFVTYANKQHRQSRLSYLYELLKAIVENNIIPARSVCEAVLSSDDLKFSNVEVWNQSFSIIYNFLPQMDYKSVRAVFSLMLNQLNHALPDSIMEAESCQLENVKKIVLMGLNRNTLLLPSYLVINDIYKLYPPANFHPHWVYGKEFTAFVNSFKALAQMVSITGHSLLVPVVGRTVSSNVWNLEPNTLKFPLKGPLPYEKSLIQPQQDLLRYVIAQPYSRDLVCSMLGLKRQQKQRCEALEDLLVDLMIVAMEKSENINDGDESHQLLWQHLSSQLIFFILFQFASFPHMLLSLHDKLQKRNLNKGRDQLMWVLLQYISGSIQKSPLSAFSPVLKLFELLYPKNKSLPVPTIIDHESNVKFAMASIWVHLSKKAKMENVPVALRNQIEYLENISKVKREGIGFETSLLCNAYSTNTETFQSFQQPLLARCYGSGQQNTTQIGPKGVPTTTNTAPLEMQLLDSLTVHAKMSLIQGIVKKIAQVASTSQQQQQSIALAPALVETYGRLLVYMEIELLGINRFISQLLPTVLKSKSWGILHTLAEMFSYRLHHIQPRYRVNLLSHLHSLLALPFTEKTQFHICVQHATIKLTMGFDSTDIQLQLSTPVIVDSPIQIISKDCEELNRVLILTIARSVHVTSADGLNLAWCEKILREIMKIMPHRWSSATFSCFPSSIQSFYKANPVPPDTNSGKALADKVEVCYRKFKTLTKDEDQISYCSEGDKSVAEIFLCILWKIFMEQKRVTPVCYYILMKLRPKATTNHLNIFTEFILYEMKSLISTGQQSQLLPVLLQCLNDLIWKYDVITIDRFLLSLVLRPHEEKDVQFDFLIVKYLLNQRHDFKSRVKKYVSENKSQHWNTVNWHEKHKQYHEQFPENFCHEGILTANNMQVQTPEYLPTYFGSICLRFLPVFDIIIHKCIETQQNATILESFLKEYGCLFKFHDRPITYLYNTLHYYEHKLCDQPRIKKSLVSAIVNAQAENHKPEWVCSKKFIEYMTSPNENRFADANYFVNLISRFVDSKNHMTAISNKVHSPPTPQCDWRFNEFANPSSYALHVTCVELMALPLKGQEVGRTIIDLLCKSTNAKIRTNIISWINAVALLLTSLPSSYLQVVNTQVCEVIQNTLPSMILMSATSLPSFFNFLGNHSMNCETQADYILAIFHVTWLHASVGQFKRLASFLKDTLKPLIMTESQLLYVMCLYGPFLQRFHTENNRLLCLFEVCGEFYFILEQVCRNTSSLVFIDLISDFFYHIKYMFVGDNLRSTIAQTIDNLHEPLQRKLKFMVTPLPPTQVPQKSPHMQQLLMQQPRHMLQQPNQQQQQIFQQLQEKSQMQQIQQLLLQQQQKQQQQ